MRVCVVSRKGRMCVPGMGYTIVLLFSSIRNTNDVHARAGAVRRAGLGFRRIFYRFHKLYTGSALALRKNASWRKQTMYYYSHIIIILLYDKKKKNRPFSCARVMAILFSNFCFFANLFQILSWVSPRRPIFHFFRLRVGRGGSYFYVPYHVLYKITLLPFYY